MSHDPSPARAAERPDPAADFMGPGAWRHGLAYGALGLPLAFVALPLYVLLPNHYARSFDTPLAALGLVLLAVRLFDALVDPPIGRMGDRVFARSLHDVLRLGALAALALALGLWGLLFPPSAVTGAGTAAVLAWLALGLAWTSTAYSVLAVTHQAWGARLGGTEAQRSRVVAWREALALAGVLLAAVLPGTAGLEATVGVFALTLALGWWAWTRARRPSPATPTAADRGLDASPWREPRFRRLLAVFVVNGIASAIPATLVLFFVQDRLQASPAMEPAFLGVYFLAAALSMPLWVRAVGRWGLARTWLVGMALAIVTFIGAATLEAGDAWAFLLVCALSGVALGTDLALPGALLTGLIADLGARGRREGAFFGWWSLAAKLNLALAAGLALPLLAWLGYTPGSRDEAALHTLTLAYCVLPCGLKALAAWLLHRLWMRSDPVLRTPARPLENLR